MEGTLRGLGYHAVAAADAAEAEALSRDEPPDVILTDEDLPTLGGLLEAVRRDGPLRGVPVIVINPDEEEGTRYGEIVVLPDYAGIAALLSNARE